MISALLDGRALTSTELAQLAAVAPSTASEHLSELTHGGLTESISQGRHRYYRLRDAEVAEALESLARICPQIPVRSLRRSTEARTLSVARVCYDHLAGDLGVELHDALVANGWLMPNRGEYEVTEEGDRALGEIGIAVDQARQSRRRFAYSCLDWTSRRYHLAGSLAALITHHVIVRGWAVPGASRRGLHVSPDSYRQLSTAFRLAPATQRRPADGPR